MQYYKVVLFLLFTGVILAVFDLARIFKSCPKNKVVYRYIPRTFEQEQDEPISVSVVFRDLFNESSPWVAGFTGKSARREPGNQNLMFISQG
jgi:hypothetical protein